MYACAGALSAQAPHSCHGSELAPATCLMGKHGAGRPAPWVTGQGATLTVEDTAMAQLEAEASAVEARLARALASAVEVAVTRCELHSAHTPHS